jgi:hypothetical protein
MKEFKKGEFPKTALGHANCGGCGKQATIYQNKNGGAYYRCGRSIEPEGWCGFQIAYGTLGTARIRAKMAQESPERVAFSAPAANQNAPPKPTVVKTANQNAKPADTPDGKKGHWLIG